MPKAARLSATVMVDRIALIPCTATREISNSSEEGNVKQITLTATFQMILMMFLNKTMRMDVFLTTHFQTIWMLGNKDKEIKEKVYFIFVYFVDLSVPSICRLYHF